jgi:hypothetical protein
MMNQLALTYMGKEINYLTYERQDVELQWDGSQLVSLNKVVFPKVKLADDEPYVTVDGFALYDGDYLVYRGKLSSTRHSLANSDIMCLLPPNIFMRF